MTLDLPVGGDTLSRLDRVLGLEANDWRSTEAVLILSEYLAHAAKKFAELKVLPPTNHQLYTAAMVIAGTQVVIPQKAMRDREVMRDFLVENTPRGDLPASFVLAGKPMVKVLPQHPAVMRKLKAVGAIRARSTLRTGQPPKANRPASPTSSVTTRLRSERK